MGSGCIVPHILTLAPDGAECSASCPTHFTHRLRAPGTHWIGGWMGSRVGMDVVAKCSLTVLMGVETQSSSP